MLPTDFNVDHWLQHHSLRDLLQAWVDLLPDEIAAFAVDQDRNIVLWNNAAEKLLGMKAQEVLGQNCRKVNRCQECLVGCPIAEFGKLHQQPLTFYLDEGRTVELQKTGVALFDAEENFLGGLELLMAPPSEEEANNPEVASAAVESNEDEDEREGPYLALTESEETELLGEMVTRDDSMKRVFQIVRNIATSEASVLIQGESGTGKELTARAIHLESQRTNGPFVAVNCGALTPSLLESELFGHSKGAFTGAITKRIGLFQRANNGTIFLDEIAEMPLHLQSKLLRVLEEREVLPLGESDPVRVDIRIISATHKSLPKEAKEGRFREDLMYRLRVVPIHLPPLRDRRRDMRLLVWHLIERYNTMGLRHITQISPEVYRLLRRYPWPGNVRELRNAIEYAFAVGRGECLLPEELPYDIIDYEPASPKVMSRKTQNASDKKQTSAFALPSHDDDEERKRIAQALKDADGHVGKAADALRISRPTLWRKRKKYNL